MYIKIRKVTAKSDEDDLTVNISKTAYIRQLKDIIFEELKIELDKQRLFYKGKQLYDDNRIHEYNMQLNDVIQLMIRIDKPEDSDIIDDEEKTDEESKPDENQTDILDNTESKTDTVESHSSAVNSICINSSEYFAVGDNVDVVDSTHGAWFEARVTNITKNTDAESKIDYHIKLENGPERDTSFVVNLPYIRLRSYYKYDLTKLSAGQTVMVNYNIEKPTTRGYWYDCEITKVTSKVLKGTIFVGRDKVPIKDCTIKYPNEIFRIENPVLLNDRPKANTVQPPFRKDVYYCEACKDVASKPCKECGCKICSGKDDADTILLCDECDYGHHIKCLNPPLDKIPSDPEWYCPDCKNDDEIVKAGEKLKFSNKQQKRASFNSSSSRDWGRGMACVGRTSECTLVPKDHYGPIPGIDVGTCWKFRVQVSESGIHRPHVAGIHGRETDGAYSLVLSGGYADDVDNGDEFIYSGSGGRDLSGNKRVSDQSCDQALTRMNKALALNCNVPLNDKGAEATDWKKGKPVRVVRNYKLGKHSKYAPKDGNRYDGLYKVVKYYPEKNKDGFLVWKYMLRRDDLEPAPWAPNGRELDIIYPPGFLEAVSLKEKEKKRKSSHKQEESLSKKKKCEPFKLNKELDDFIAADKSNEKLWNECKSVLSEGKQCFLSKVEEIFMCICCLEVVYNPVTTDCKHNVCKSCLSRSFSTGIHNCPCCRFTFEKDFQLKINKNLSEVLMKLFPGYEAGR